MLAMGGASCKDKAKLIHAPCRAVPRQAGPLCWPESHSSTSAFQAIVVTHFRSPCQPLLLLVLRLLYSSFSSNLHLSIRLVEIKVQDYVNPILYILCAGSRLV